MRISDWSSDVCSSDLVRSAGTGPIFIVTGARRRIEMGFLVLSGMLSSLISGMFEDGNYRAIGRDISILGELPWLNHGTSDSKRVSAKIGRASCRERVCQYV